MMVEVRACAAYTLPTSLPTCSPRSVLETMRRVVRSIITHVIQFCLSQSVFFFGNLKVLAYMWQEDMKVFSYANVLVIMRFNYSERVCWCTTELCNSWQLTSQSVASFARDRAHLHFSESRLKGAQFLTAVSSAFARYRSDHPAYSMLFRRGILDYTFL